jgi:hypothetical protein
MFFSYISWKNNNYEIGERNNLDLNEYKNKERDIKSKR